MSGVGWYMQYGSQWYWSTASTVAATFGWSTGTIFWFAPVVVAP